MGNSASAAATNERVRIVVGVNREDEQTRTAVRCLLESAARASAGGQTTVVEGWHLAVLLGPRFDVPASDLVLRHGDGPLAPWPVGLIAEHRLEPCIEGPEGTQLARERSVLQTTGEAFAHAADVFVLTTDAPAANGQADRGFFALRQALRWGKAVIWLRHERTGSITTLYSAAPDPTLAQRLDRLHRSHGHGAWIDVLAGEPGAAFLGEGSTDIDAWFKHRVWPLLDGGMHLPGVSAARGVRERSAGTGMTEPQLFEQLLDAQREPQNGGTAHPPAKESSFFGPDPATDRAALARAFGAADAQAGLASADYRLTVWSGYGLAFLAVGATAWSAVFKEGSTPAAPAQTLVALGWVASVAALIAVLFWFWLRRSRSRRVVAIKRLGTITIGVALVGGAVLPSWLELPAWTSSVEIVALVIAVVWVIRAWSSQTHERWMAMRTLAEALRCDLVLRPLVLRSHLSSRTSLEAPDDAAAPARVPVLASALAWHIARIHACQPLPAAAAGTQEIHLAHAGHLLAARERLDDLIDGQLAYHRARAAWQHSRGRCLHWVSIGAFVGLAIGAVAHIFLPALYPEPSAWHEFVVFLMIVLPALAAAAHGLAAQLEFDRLAADSARIVARLEADSRRLHAVNMAATDWSTVEELRAIALDATRTISADASAWFELICARPVKLVA